MTEPLKYRKRPVVIEAMAFTGANDAEVAAWVAGGGGKTGWVNAIPEARFTIATLEGAMVCSPGDFILRGVKGEFYPCKPDIFAATYEEVL